MDIDVIGGKNCLVFYETDPLVTLLRHVRNAEVMAMLSGERPGVSDREVRLLAGTKTPRLVETLNELGLLFRNREVVGRGFGTVREEIYWTSTKLGERVIALADRAYGEEIVVPFGRKAAA